MQDGCRNPKKNRQRDGSGAVVFKHEVMRVTCRHGPQTGKAYYECKAQQPVNTPTRILFERAYGK